MLLAEVLAAEREGRLEQIFGSGILTQTALDAAQGDHQIRLHQRGVGELVRDLGGGFVEHVAQAQVHSFVGVGAVEDFGQEVQSPAERSAAGAGLP